ncbi:MAG: ATP-binding protein [Candidatus Omnitrophota bacterium]
MFKRIKQIKFNSIRFKVSLFYMALLGAILISYTGVLFFGQRFALYRDLDRELSIKAQEVTNAINSFLPALEDDQRAFRLASDAVIRQDGISTKQAEITKSQKQWLAVREKLNIQNDYVVLASTERNVVTNSPNVDKRLLEHLLKNISRSGEKTVAYQDINSGAYRLRLITIPYYYKNKRTYFIEIGTSRVPVTRILYGSLFFALFTIPFILIFTSFLGGLITERILRPVKEVINIAKNITIKDLSSRVKIENVDEELSYLVDAFNEMISRLDSSFRYIDEFSSNVAHELKTPLTIIIGESELALMQTRDIEEYKRVIDVNLREAGQLIKIVEDLLLLSKLEHQSEAFKFEQIDLFVFLEEIFEHTRKLALLKNISVSLEQPDKPVSILADWLHLRRLFINLLDNAVKFSAQGGKITILAKLETEKVSVSVSDTGVGIAPDNLNKIFRRFFRIDYVGSADKSGSGLGLSIAHSIAKIHHGDISVSSQLGKGSTFTVILPCNTLDSSST